MGASRFVVVVVIQLVVVLAPRLPTSFSRVPLLPSPPRSYKNAAPVHAFGPQNELGLHNMIGNVWEWVGDYWSTTHVPRPDGEVEVDPKGPPRHASTGERTKKGGSYMCHASYCHRYRLQARSQNSADTGTSNLGLRCAKPAA